MTSVSIPDIKVFVDGADFDSLKKAMALPFTAGFTTNPSLVAQAGAKDYLEYAQKALELVNGMPISFEVLGETPELMEKEARIIRTWGPNVYVKVPVVSADGEPMGKLIKKLSGEGIPLNVTCVFTPEQACLAADSLNPAVPSLVSVFAGRIADVGVDPIPIVEECREILATMPKAELLWASTREVYNIWQAYDAGCKVITAPLSMVTKLSAVGKDLTELSIEGVKAFMRDTAAAGVKFKI